MENKRRTGTLCVFLAAVLYSIGGLCIKLIPWGGMAINGARTAIALGVIGAYLIRHPLRFNRWVAVGALSIFGTNALFSVANKLTTAANVIVLQFTAPIFVILFSALFWRRKPGRLDLLACGIVFGGVLFFFADSLEMGGGLGNVLALLSGVAYAGVFLMNELPDSDAISSVFWGDVLSAVTGLPFLLGEAKLEPIALTSLLVLGISGLFVLVAIVVLWVAARSVSRPLNWLCREAEKIGTGDFSEIAPTFSLRELEQLRESMNEMARQLQRSAQVQKDFFQNVSHELRNPLMSISGYAQGIEQGVFPAPKEAAHTILEESVRLTELVNSLLTLSRMESGQNPPVLVPVPLGDVIGDCLDRFHGLALQKDVALSASSVDESVSVLGDEELLGKVLDNLVSNAVRYAKSTVTVAVSAEESYVQISVLDDGAGIAENDLPHLFERCYKGKGGNFGLGLSIALTAARAMGGDLTAANRPEGGAVFTLTLPRAKPYPLKELL